MAWYGKDGPFATSHPVTADEWNSQRVPYFHDGSSSISLYNSAALTEMFTFTIPAGLIGANGSMRLKMHGAYLNNSGADRTLRVAVMLGGTTYLNDVSANIPASANTRIWDLEAFLHAAGSTSGQILSVRMWMGAAGSATTGTGELGSVTQAIDGMVMNAAGAKDMTSAQAYSVAMQHSVANANLEIHRYGHILEVFPAITASP